MARVDRIKEEIGRLKVPFGLLAVVDASLLGWLALSYTKANPVLVAAASGAAIVETSGIVQINHIAYRRIDDLEENDMEWFVIVPSVAFVLAFELIIREASRHRPSRK